VDKTRRKVFQVVDDCRDVIIGFLQKMIEFRSVTGEEKDSQVWLGRELERIGFEVDMFEPDNEKLKQFGFAFIAGHRYEGRPNVVGRKRGKGEGRSIILNGHMDVVPPGSLEKWSHNPWIGKIEDGYLYGRGAADMKGGITAAIMAIRCLQMAGVDLKGDAIVESVVDEEATGNGTLACVAKGYRADGAIVAEPTSLDIQVAHKGALRLRLIVPGFAGHSSRKWDFVNAIEKTRKIMDALSDLEKRWLASMWHPILQGPSVTPTMISAGNAMNVIPDKCVIAYDVRYLPGYTDEKGFATHLKKKIEECVSISANGDSWLKDHKPDIEWLIDTDPSEIDPSHELVQTLLRVQQEVKGTAKISGLMGGCDMRHLVNRSGIPTVIYGPGSLSVAHTIDEYVDVEELVVATKILALMLMDWCGW